MIRLQRDLSDSTVLRNIGVGFGYTYLSLTSLQKGLGKVQSNPELMRDEILQHPEILGEAYQSYFRYKGVKNAYEKLKDATRGKDIRESDLHSLVDTIDELTDSEKQKVKDLKVEGYYGDAIDLAKRLPLEINKLRK